MCEPQTTMGALALAMILIGLFLIGTVGIIFSEEIKYRKRRRRRDWYDLT